MSNKTLSHIVNKAAEKMPANDAAFLSRIYASGLDTYANRLRAIGFVGMDSVLDAGCGFGQWSLALADMNASVAAVDVADNRIEFIRRAGESLCPGKISPFVGSTSETNLPAMSFDGVFCYGVLFLTPWKESLAEFARVLKPGGRLYVNANGLGWYKHLWYNAPNPADDYDPTEHAARVLLNTWNYRKGQPIKPGMDILVEPDELRSELENLGFENICVGGEGTLRAGNDPVVEAKSFFQSEYLGDTGVYEVTATKCDG